MFLRISTCQWEKKKDIWIFAQNFNIFDDQLNTVTEEEPKKKLIVGEEHPFNM